MEWVRTARKSFKFSRPLLPVRQGRSWQPQYCTRDPLPFLWPLALRGKPEPERFRRRRRRAAATPLRVRPGRRQSISGFSVDLSGLHRSQVFAEFIIILILYKIISILDFRNI